MRDIKEESEKLYAELQSESGFKVGDMVRVLRSAEYRQWGWPEVWIPGRKGKFVLSRREFKILRIDKTGIILQYDENDCTWHFPFFVLEKVEPVLYHCGQRFKYDGKDDFMLVQIDTEIITMVLLQDGNRWGKSIKVNNSKHVTEEEMVRLIGMQWDKFTVLKGQK